MLEKSKFQCPTCNRIFSAKEDYISHALTRHQMSQPKTVNLQQLSPVPYEKGFHFFTEVGKYTGISATSLYEFAEKLNYVPIESVMFHFQRDDYQRWLMDVIGDDELAKKIDKIKETDWVVSGEGLRKALSQTVQNDLAELKQNSQQM